MNEDISLRVDVDKAIANLREYANTWAKKNRIEAESIEIYAKLSEEGNAYEQVIKGLTTSGQQLTTTLKNVKDGLAISSTVSEATGKLREQARTADLLATKIANLSAILKKGVSLENASPVESLRYNEALAAVASFIRQNKIGAAEINQIWRNVGAGTFKEYEGELGRLQRLLFNVKQAEQNLGIEDAALRASADKAAAAIARQRQALTELNAEQNRRKQTAATAIITVAKNDELAQQRNLRQQITALATLANQQDEQQQAAHNARNKALLNQATSILAVAKQEQERILREDLAKRRAIRQQITVLAELATRDAKASTIGNFLQRGVDTTTSTTKELINYKEAITQVKNLATQHSISLNRIKAIWRDLSSGTVKAYSGSLSTVQRSLYDVLQAQNQLGASHRKEISLANEQAKKYQEVADSVYKLIQAKRSADIFTRLAKSEIRSTGTVEQNLTYERAIASVRRYIEQNKIADATVRKLWSDTVRGITDASGKYGELQGLMGGVKRAQDAINLGIQKSTENTKELILSWRSVLRLAAIQLAHRAISNLVVATRESIQTATDYEIKIAEIRTIVEQTDLSTQYWAKSLTTLSNNFGIDVLTQAEAAYQAISNQITKGADTIDFLNEANRLAITTTAQTNDAVNILSSAINSYGYAVENSSILSAKFFEAVNLGKFRLNEISDTFGRVSVTADQLGISIDELLASLTVMTRKGLPASEAMTQMRNIMTKLLKPTEEMKDLLHSLGVESGEQALKLYNFGEFMALIQEKTQGSSSEIAKFFNNIRGQTGALIFAGQGVQEYNSDLQRIADSQKQYSDAVTLTLENNGRHFKIEMERIKNYFINDFGRTILSMIADIDGDGHTLSNTVIDITNTLVHLAGPVLGLMIARMTILNTTFIQAAASAGTLGIAVRELNFATAANGALLAVTAFITTVELLRQREENNIRRANEAIEDNFQRWKSAEQAKTQVQAEALVKQSDAVLKHLAQVYQYSYAAIAKDRILWEKYAKDYANLFESSTDRVKISLSNLHDAIRENIQGYTSAVTEAKNNIKSIAKDIETIKFNGAKTLFSWAIEDKTIPDKIKAINDRIKELKATVVNDVRTNNVENYKRDSAEILSLIEKQHDLQHDFNQSLDKDADTKQKLDAKIREAELAAQKKNIDLTKKLHDDKRKLRNAQDRDQKKDLKTQIELIKQQLADTSTPELKQLKDQRAKLVDQDKKKVDYAQEYIKAIREQINLSSQLARQQELQERQALVQKYKRDQAFKVITTAISNVEGFKFSEFAKQSPEEMYKSLIDLRANLQTLLAGQKAFGVNVVNPSTLVSQYNIAKERYNVELKINAAREKANTLAQQQKVTEKELLDRQKDVTKNSADYTRLVDAAIKARLALSGLVISKGVIELLVEADSQGYSKDTKLKSGNANALPNVAGTAADASAYLFQYLLNNKAFTEKEARDLIQKELLSRLSIIIEAGQKQQITPEIQSTAAQLIPFLTNYLKTTPVANEKSDSVLSFRKDIETLRASLYKVVNNGYNSNAKTNYDDFIKQLGAAKTVTDTITLDPFIKSIEKAIPLTDEFIKKLKEISAAPTTKPVKGYAAGGYIPNGTDTVPAMLTPGEFVINREAARKYRHELMAMNRGTWAPIFESFNEHKRRFGLFRHHTKSPWAPIFESFNEHKHRLHFSEGGEVPGRALPTVKTMSSVTNQTNVNGDFHITLTPTGNTNVDVQHIGKLLQREIRRGTIQLT